MKVHEYHYRTRWPEYLNHIPELVELYKVEWEKYRANMVQI